MSAQSSISITLHESLNTTHLSRCASRLSSTDGHETSTSNCPSRSPRFPTACNPPCFKACKSLAYCSEACLAFFLARTLGCTWVLPVEERKTSTRSTLGVMVLDGGDCLARKTVDVVASWYEREGVTQGCINVCLVSDESREQS